jgi:hypothetical protein
MPRLLKDLEIRDVSSVDRGAGVGVKVMLMKRDTQQENETMQHNLTFEDIRKAATAGALSRADIGALRDAEVLKARRDGESEQQTLARCIDRRSDRYNEMVHKLLDLSDQLGRASNFEQPDHYVEKAKPHADPGGAPDQGKSDHELRVRQYMRQHKVTEAQARKAVEGMMTGK